jgi:hypothetical protein
MRAFHATKDIEPQERRDRSQAALAVETALERKAEDHRRERDVPADEGRGLAYWGVAFARPLRLSPTAQQGADAMQEAADVIDQIIRRGNLRGEIDFALNNGGSVTLTPPYTNVGNIAISGVARGGEFTIVIIASVATITIRGKPDDSNFNRPL